MANLSAWVREGTSESRATRRRRLKGEQDWSALSKAEMGEASTGGGDSSDVSVLGLKGAPGADRHGSPPRSQLRSAPSPLRYASHSLSASPVVRLPTSPASGRLLPPGPPENLAWTRGVPD
ncbi:MAG: hypothetical protein ACI8RZ_008114 [Myxococcota bacterium]|jgi:hypothetical protein